MAAGPNTVNTCALAVVIRGTAYSVRPVRPQSGDVHRAFRLKKSDGAAYTVADTDDGPSCECPDFVFRRDGTDPGGCKHVRALRALGLLDPDQGGAETWPAWTDSHAYTTSR